MELILFGIAVAVAAVLFFTRKKSRSEPIYKGPVGVWSFHRNTKGSRISRNESQRVSFNIPKKPGLVNYVWKRRAISIKQKYLVISGVITASPDAEVGWKQEKGNEGQGTCYMRPIIQHENDDWQSANGRFWSGNGVKLIPGEFRIKVPLDWEEWTNVYGKTSVDGFEKILQKPGRIGVTLGGGNFYGHGVQMLQGTMKVFIKEFRLVND